MRLGALLALVGAVAAQVVDQDCLVTPWDSPGACSVTCGTGVRTKTRHIAVHSSGAGAVCPPLTEDETCNASPCPTGDQDCHYSQWQFWSLCKCEGGEAGTQQRERAVMHEARGGGAACDTTKLKETRACPKDTCKPVNCVLGNWQPWNACSKECGGGTQKRTMEVREAATNGGTCDLRARGGIEERACNTQPCLDEPDLKVVRELQLAGESGDRVIAVDTAGVVWSGGKKLFKIVSSDTGLTEAGTYDPSPLTSITAVTADAAHVYVAGNYDDNGSTKHELHKIMKADLTRVGRVTDGVDAEIKAMVTDAGKLYTSVASDDMGTVQRFATADLSMELEGTIAAQGDVMRIDGSHIWVGTWKGQLLKLDTVDMQTVAIGEPGAAAEPFVSMRQNATHLFVGTDTVATNAEGGRVILVAKDNLDAEVTSVGLAKHGMCVSMTGDAHNVYCGTSTGEVLKIEKQNLGFMASLGVRKGGGLYGIAHDNNGHLYAATYETTGASVVEVDGYLSPKDCKLSPWSAWSTSCVEYYSRQPVDCGSGVNIRQREVQQAPVWGGAKCDKTIDTQACVAPQPTCCHAGHVWSKTRYSYDCVNEVQTSTEESTFACRCPADKPLAIGHTCMANHHCKAQTCKHTHCRFQHGKIRVQHRGHSAQTLSKDLNHHCSYTEGRTGSCDCVCWEQECSDASDCGAGKVCEDGYCRRDRRLSNASLRTAVALWFSDKAAALAEYGPMAQWDTSEVTDMSNLFKDRRDFNEDISAWDTSKVTTMSGMFYHAQAFDQPIGAWDTSKVTTMRRMFSIARAFNQPIGAWNTGKVTNMYAMFSGTHAFNQPIGAWDTSKVTDMCSMFAYESAFNQPIGSWDTSKVTDMNYMFFRNRVFNQPIAAWTNGGTKGQMFSTGPYVLCRVTASGPRCDADDL